MEEDEEMILMLSKTCWKIRIILTDPQAYRAFHAVEVQEMACWEYRI